MIAEAGGGFKRLGMSDLVTAAAEANYTIKPRLITDWVSLGLLDRPEGRGRGQGKGRSYTWAHEQRDLLLILLGHHGTVRRPVLCNIPVGVWLMFGDQYVPLRQVRRALATWAATYSKVTFNKAKGGAAHALLQLDHPDALEADQEQLRRLLTQVGRGGSVGRDQLAEAAHKVFDPHRSGIARGPAGLLDAEAYVRIVVARVEGQRAIKTVPDGHYYAARRTYLSTNPVSDELRTRLEPNPRLVDPRVLAPQSHGFQAAVQNACLDLITLLGLIELEPPTNPGFATKEGPPPPRWNQPRPKLKM